MPGELLHWHSAASQMKPRTSVRHQPRWHTRCGQSAPYVYLVRCPRALIGGVAGQLSEHSARSWALLPDWGGEPLGHGADDEGLVLLALGVEVLRIIVDSEAML